jgi:hypothetical protein
VRQSTQPANRSNTSRAWVLPVYRHTSSSPARVLCSEYHDTDRGLPASIASKSDSGKPDR